MRLREFSLSAQTGERVSPHSDAHRFRLQTRCVTALFERLFPKFMESRGWKVLVECVPAEPDAKVRNQLGVLTIQKVFDVRAFLAAAPRRKKVVALEVLWGGITDVAAAEGWPLEPFEEARRAVLERDYVNEWSWPTRPVRERRSGWKAQLQCRHEVDAFRAWAVVTGKDGLELTRKLVVDEPPDEFQFVPRLGALVWTRPDRVTLAARDGAVVATVDVV